jgi:hypothetical protein
MLLQQIADANVTNAKLDKATFHYGFHVGTDVALGNKKINRSCRSYRYADAATKKFALIPKFLCNHLQVEQI